MEAALPFDIEELVGNRAVAEAMAGLARRHGRRIRYHLALNSAGMSRNGIELATPEGRRDTLALLQLTDLHLVGIMTHFPVEDAAEMRRGLAGFNADVAWVIREGGLNRATLLVHAANSFATLEMPESRLDLVRVGGALYGDTIPERTEYVRVMAFKSRVAAVNHYPAGNTVSYDRTFTLKRDSRLANLPVGYSDGYRRVFSNQGHVLIRGRRCPIVGRVTMNTIMVDVTDIPEVAAGDEAVLFGRQGDAAVTQAELEKSAGTILVDLYTVWGNSNPKILVRP
jgi:alanine racemase